MARRASAPDTRAAVFAAAAGEVAAPGFAAAGVARIAAAAGVNKAMLYYHFGSKRALYHAILQDMFDAVGARVHAIAAGPEPAPAKVDAWVQAIFDEARARPHFPSIMLRELAEGVPHVDAATLARMMHVFDGVRRILAEGQKAGVFRDVHPFLMHITILAPTVLFIARDRVIAGRRRIPAEMKAFAAPIAPQAFVRHMQEMARRTLAKDGSR